MTIFQAIVLGIIQGLTEFLPISSSAHLVIIPFFLNWKMEPEAMFIFDVLIQVGTLTAVIAYFWQDLVSISKAWLIGNWNKKPFTDPQARLGWYLIIATLPAGIVGLLFKDQVEATFTSPLATAIFLIVTAVFLFAADRISIQIRTLQEVNWKDAVLIGLFQALAILPGISRSGSTITGGMLRNLDRPSAARFSFLMSVPIMLAAGLTASIDLVQMDNLTVQIPIILAGFITSAIVGYLSIRWLLSYLTHHPLTVFSIYCLVISGITLVVYVIR
jgi:undecaprenyl-diphosphatase